MPYTTGSVAPQVVQIINYSKTAPYIHLETLPPSHLCWPQNTPPPQTLSSAGNGIAEAPKAVVPMIPHRLTVTPTDSHRPQSGPGTYHYTLGLLQTTEKSVSDPGVIDKSAHIKPVYGSGVGHIHHGSDGLK